MKSHPNTLASSSRRIKIPKSARLANLKALQRDLGGLVRQGKAGNRQAVAPHNPPSPTQIRALRQLLGLTQVSFASQLGVVPMTISTWEIGFRAPRRAMTDHIRELATMNGVDMERITDPAYYNSKLEVKIFAKRKRTA
jgi:DNA-binding XRE family transcriptional regulator